MKQARLLLVLVWVSLSSAVSGATSYVNVNNPTPVPPFSSWATAATNIQDAIDTAAVGDTVTVTDGVYSVGGRAVLSSGAGAGTNIVSITKAIAVQSVNGPWVTTIRPGIKARCAWLTNGASLTGFTLTNGFSANGGGVWCMSSNAIVANCVIVSNTGVIFGGGAYQGTLNNCFIYRNGGKSVAKGAAAYLAYLNNCTVTANTTPQTGGIPALDSCVATNCIVRFNDGGNYTVSTLSYCCTSPLPSGSGNFTDNPGFFVDKIHLTNGSPCVGVGTNVAAVGSDIYGNAWNNPPSVGCVEWQPAPYILTPRLQYTNQPIGFSIAVDAINAQMPFSIWWIKDGTPLSDDNHFNFTQTTNLIANGVRFSDSGNYQLVASNSFGMTTSAVIQVTIHAVDVNSTNPIAPYSSLATAATNIQDAVDAATAGEIILVNDGIYSFGGEIITNIFVGPTNRVALDKPVTVTSANGYKNTIIQGAWDSLSTNGPAAVRCVYLTTNAMLNGFTLENGATFSDTLAGTIIDSGGGIFCASSNSIVSNCLLTNNWAVYGGGICNGTLNNSLVDGNFAMALGGGAYFATLNNCTVIGNAASASIFFPNNGAGVYNCNLRNSIALYNSTIYYVLSPGYNYYGGSLNYSCSDPLPSGIGNVDANPQFLDLFHIASTSPCFGTGSATYSSGTDLDGDPWQNPPSMGCDEVIVSNLVGPLSVSLQARYTNWVTSVRSDILNRFDYFWGTIVGNAGWTTWSFGDGPAVTNFGVNAGHSWTNVGDYVVTFTAYNNDNPSGVSTNLIVHVNPLITPQLQPTFTATNGFQFQFLGETNAGYFVDYYVQYTTNLTPPVTWQTLQDIFYNYYNFSTNNVIQFTDSPTNSIRFYRVLAQ